MKKRFFILLLFLLVAPAMTYSMKDEIEDIEVEDVSDRSVTSHATSDIIGEEASVDEIFNVDDGDTGDLGKGGSEEEKIESANGFSGMDHQEPVSVSKVDFVDDAFVGVSTEDIVKGLKKKGSFSLKSLCSCMNFKSGKSGERLIIVIASMWGLNAAAIVIRLLFSQRARTSFWSCCKAPLDPFSFRKHIKASWKADWLMTIEVILFGVLTGALTASVARGLILSLDCSKCPKIAKKFQNCLRLDCLKELEPDFRVKEKSHEAEDSNMMMCEQN